MKWGQLRSFEDIEVTQGRTIIGNSVKNDYFELIKIHFLSLNDLRLFSGYDLGIVVPILFLGQVHPVKPS